MDRFDGRPEALVDYCFAEISEVAAQVSIRWESIASTIRLDGQKHKKHRGMIETLDKKSRGKVMAWGQTRKTGTGIEYPHLTFNHNVLGSSVWNGYDALADLYKLHGGQIEDETEHQKWKQAQLAKAEARKKAQAEAERLEREAAALVEAERAAYEQAWFRGGRVEFQAKQRGVIITAAVEVIGEEDGSAPYFQAKQISDIAPLFRMQRMRDHHGEFTAIPLFDINGDFRGLQRLYADKKLQGAGVNMDGAHCIIGDLEEARRIYAVEGFATGASVYLAEQVLGNRVAVIITLSVGNLPKVLQQYHKRHPSKRIHNAADNDQWTRAGNAGVLAALEIHREYQHPATLPDFSALGAEALAEFKAKRKGPTDWNDYHCLFGLKATAKALRARSMLKAEADWFTYRLQCLPHSGEKAERAAMGAVSAGMMLVPIKHSSAEVIERVIDALPEGFDFNLHRIKRWALTLARAKMQEAQELRGFTAKALAKPNVQHLKLPGVRAAHGGIELPDHIADLVESLEGFVIVRAPMGSGKTEKLIAPIMANAPKAGYIAHRISLLDDAACRLKIQHYQQVIAVEMPYVSHLACCVNSLTNPKFYNEDERSWFTTVDTLCIDEASQVIRHTTTGPVESPVRVLDALLDAMASAKRVLLCDADANDAVIQLCEEAAPGRPITILEVDGSMEHVTVKFGDHETTWQKSLDLMLAGHRVMVASDSAEDAKKLAAMVKEKRPEAKLLLVHKDSKADPQVEAFLANPSAEAARYEILIYSPAISSGVSMTLPHFQHHIGLFTGNTVGPSDAIQMLRRDRTARHYLIGIGHSTALRETNRETIFRGLIAADELACEYEETSEDIILRRQKTAFDELYLSCLATENRAKNSFANNLLLMLHADGYVVERVATDEDLAKVSRKNRKQAGQLVFSHRMDLIESVETPSDEEFAKLDRMEIRSERESAQIDRYQIEHQLGVQQITADDVAFYDDRGISKVVAMELLQATEEQALAFDKAQRKAKVTLTKSRFKTAGRAFLRETFETLGIDIATGSGTFSAAACRALLGKIQATPASLERYNALRLGKLVPAAGKKCCATTVVKSILQRLGLGVQKRASNGQNLYQINPEHWEFIMGYVTNRAAIGVHSLTTHEPASTHQPKPAQAQASGSDTLQSGVIAPDLKYHLKLRSEIYAAARRSFKPIGTTLAQLVEGLAPEVAEGFAKPGANGKLIGFTLAYAQRLQQARQ
ncbi:plasmid replication protein, CyRepA1 family [Pseudomonas luteola]|uniref:plasmid replication protein, CyRepA1 family n=1 Tax=Pseudomonas luteola TaxID=47886 RepID=UPI0015E27176|nr:plasmid replication protein, CyRepA1 family [Pseudomonas zeshuii]MBA1250942.1 hypothetical protein [Pseudomonas zeshuii]